MQFSHGRYETRSWLQMTANNAVRTDAIIKGGDPKCKNIKGKN